jgi:hypothetical protein
VHVGFAIRDFSTGSRPSIWGTGGNHPEPSAVGPIGISGIGVSGISRTRNPCITKPRYAKFLHHHKPLIQGTRVGRSEEVANRRIGVPGGKNLLHVGIAIRDIPTGVLKPSICRGTCQRIPRNRGSAFRDFQRQRNCCIRNRDFTISDITTGKW